MIIVSSPKKIPEIKKEIEKYYNDIKEKTNWESFRKPSDLKIELGEAPGYFESFGVSRFDNKLIFGKWLNNINPKYAKENLWEFLLIRESIALFINKKLFLNVKEILTNIFLNLATLSYIKSKYTKTSIDLKISHIRSRLRIIPNEVKKNEDLIYLKFASLLSEVIKKDIKYKTIIDNYLHFIKGYSEEEIDIEELIDDFSRYISTSAEMIASPIRLKETTNKVLFELIKGGFNTSSFQIADKLKINQSTVSRQLSKIDARFYAKWRAVKNWSGLGLQKYLIYIRLPIGDKNKFDFYIEELLKIKYFYQIYKGINEQYTYIYSIFHYPFSLIKNLKSKFARYKRNNQLSSFEIIQINNTIFRSAITTKKFDVNIMNFKKLLNGEIPIIKLKIWEDKSLNNRETLPIKGNEKQLLQFLSILISNSITSYSNYGLWVPQLEKLLIDNKIDPQNVNDGIAFINKLQTQLLKRNYLDYMLLITLNTATSNYLILKISENPEEVKVKEFLSEISCFGNITFLISQNELIISLIGPKYNDSLTHLLKKKLDKFSLHYEIFSNTLVKWRYVPYDELFDFDSKKWKIS